jgi:hypothetical protein
VLAVVKMSTEEIIEVLKINNDTVSWLNQGSISFAKLTFIRLEDFLKKKISELSEEEKNKVINAIKK